MRPVIPAAICLLFAGSALLGSQDRGGGLFGPPDSSSGKSGREGRGKKAGARDREVDKDRVPAPEERLRGPQPMTPELVELGASYFIIADYNRDGWISFREASESLMLDDRSRFARLDKNQDGRIDQQEFQASYELTMRKTGNFPPPIPDPNGEPPAVLEGVEVELGVFERGEDFVFATNITELFGQAEVREMDDGSTRQPPYIAGPIGHFRRLDVDLDGEITDRDLDNLLRPMQVRTRIRAVIAIMDTDASGGISQAEFDSAMRHDG